MPDGAAFDHLINWVSDLGAALEAYEEYGLPTHAALTMPGFRNGAWAVDDERYVELATVDDWEAVKTSKYGEGVDILKPAVDALEGPGLLTFAVDVPDARAVADQFRAAGREVKVLEVWFEDKNAGFVEVFVQDVPAYFPFFITYDPPRAELGRIRAEYRAAAGITPPTESPELVALLAGSADPEGEARVLADFVGRPVQGAVVGLPGAQVRFERASRCGLLGVVVRGPSLNRSTTIAGVKVIAEQL